MPDKFEVTCRTVGLVVNAPDIFQRSDFMAWLNDPLNAAATWHPLGKEPTHFSDVFVLVDFDYNGDSSEMPEDIWISLCNLVYREF